MTLRPCPECGAPLERHTGIIETPAGNPNRDRARYGPPPPIRRLGTYELCTGCEYGEEC